MAKNTVKRVVVRANLSGVWFGELVNKNKDEVSLRNARRIWAWDGGALSCSEIALTGVTGGKICPPVNVTLMRSDCIEIIDAKVTVLP